ncbi:protease inhibitor SIL-V5 [Streptomyces sp. WAC 01529]|uniref:SSI family serine proteinase inhibitor n=1 Tax=Streptomyces sp. WAC 01529 TaxID=2203205 RepID=UPI000F6D5F39|nr:SSI family serine proteinase inhibitor [Streptomyces sp. WAC 01529]AZM51401.1 protease inhibitor SIL-V5 [Streptomyces sp. WAC 01529]
MRPFTVAAAALIALGAAVPAHAADEALTPKKRGLILTVSGSEDTWIRGVLLRCRPEPMGPHPHAAEACAAIDRAKGNFDRLPDDPHLCTKQYDPVTVSATGTHRNRSVSWHKTYANACEMDADTGYVFRF